MSRAAYTLAPQRENPHGLILGSCEDRLPPSDQDARWRRNDSTKYLESRIPLTWCGMREYFNILGRARIRVLHRPGQVQAASFMRGLRQLPIAAGHPMVGGKSVDVDTRNARRFEIGRVGDSIDLVTVPMLNGTTVIGECQVPAGNASIFDEPSIAKITNPRDPHTQTSLGYLPLWAPPSEAETIGEVDGFPVGVFVTADGQRVEYDKDHVLDTQDPRVLALAEANPEFVPDSMGPNHLAAVLRRGRGDQASELLRLVDCRDAAGTRTHFFFSGPPTRDQSAMTEAASTQAIAPTVPVRVCDFSTPHRNLLVKHGVNLPFRTLDMPNPEAAAALQMIMGELGKIVELLSGAEQAAESMEGERDAQGELLKKAEEEKVVAEEAAVAADAKLKSALDELAPIKMQLLHDLKFKAAKILGVTDAADAAQTAKLPDAVHTGATASAVKRATVIALDARDGQPTPGIADKSDDYFEGRFAGLREPSANGAANDGGNAPTPLGAIDVATASPFGRAVDSGSASPRPVAKTSALRAGVGFLNSTPATTTTN